MLQERTSTMKRKIKWFVRRMCERRDGVSRDANIFSPYLSDHIEILLLYGIVKKGGAYCYHNVVWSIKVESTYV